MNWGLYGFLFVFAMFILLMLINPNLSCFGKRIKSPLYPLFRKKKKHRKTEDYGFKLVEGSPKKQVAVRKPSTEQESRKVEDYGFKLFDEEEGRHEKKGKKGEN
ncbi:MAG: hypothetical protein JXB26_15605 [Candidatus Aminicenantes bacterium]|nr:hypothetical protein [Candidatus Aminicenantes bacterium]